MSPTGNADVYNTHHLNPEAISGLFIVNSIALPVLMTLARQDPSALK